MTYLIQFYNKGMEPLGTSRQFIVRDLKTKRGVINRAQRIAEKLKFSWYDCRITQYAGENTYGKGTVIQLNCPF